MGYTHYWEVKKPKSKEWEAAWSKLINSNVPAIIKKAKKDQGIELVGPAPPGKVSEGPPIINMNKGIRLNGHDDEGFENFELKKASKWDFCKTGRRPYDLVVCCILLRAYLLAPESFKLSSDGFWEDENEWGCVHRFYTELFGEETSECPWQDEIEEEEVESEDRKDVQ